MKGWDDSHIERLKNRGLVVDDEPTKNKHVSDINVGDIGKIIKSHAEKKYEYYIGIDPGVNTGVAIWNGKILIQVVSMPIHEAIEKIKLWLGMKILVRLEDARKRNWFGESGREQLQGAGSIKRDCKIWEDFLTDYNVPFELVAPKNNKTKVDAKLFTKVTRWKGITNEHSRDAAMLVYGFNCKSKIDLNKRK